MTVVDDAGWRWYLRVPKPGTVSVSPKWTLRVRPVIATNCDRLELYVAGQHHCGDNENVRE
ncbi:MAG TPA: hypothetical protein VGM75_05680 [Pseudonocardiaceae bacterium]